MAITPEEAETLTEGEVLGISLLEREIDRNIKAEFKKGKNVALVPCHAGTTNEINHVKNTYSSLGWSVEIVVEHRDDEYFEFKPLKYIEEYVKNGG